MNRYTWSGPSLAETSRMLNPNPFVQTYSTGRIPLGLDELGRYGQQPQRRPAAAAWEQPTFNLPTKKPAPPAPVDPFARFTRAPSYAQAPPPFAAFRPDFNRPAPAAAAPPQPRYTAPPRAAAPPPPPPAPKAVSTSCSDILKGEGIATRDDFVKRWVRKNHPDRGGDTAKFQKVSDCVDKLGGRRTRKRRRITKKRKNTKRTLHIK